MDVISQMALRDWRTLNQVIGAMTEGQLDDALEFEKRHERRQTVLIRLHQRLTKIRSERERKELIDMSLGTEK